MNTHLVLLIKAFQTGACEIYDIICHECYFDNQSYFTTCKDCSKICENQEIIPPAQIVEGILDDAERDSCNEEHEDVNNNTWCSFWIVAKFSQYGKKHNSEFVPPATPVRPPSDFNVRFHRQPWYLIRRPPKRRPQHHPTVLLFRPPTTLLHPLICNKK